MSQPTPIYKPGDHVAILFGDFKEGHVVEIRYGIFACYYRVRMKDAHEVEFDESEITPWVEKPGTLMQRLEAEACRLRKTGSLHTAALIEEAIQAIRPKSVHEALEECKKWALTDAELEELMK